MTTALAMAVAVSLMVAGPVPSSAAADTQYVRTTSGKVRCLVSGDGTGTGAKGPVVICEASDPLSPPFDQWDNVGFLQAPLTSTGLHYHNAVVDSAGNFRFEDGGNIGAGRPDKDLILDYGKTYRVKGWTVNASSDGTRFACDDTGHGMFVSIENVYSF
ncbi:hypothetical protein [Mycobacterium sp. 1274756.6]|uniref:hypothetical protein n=1 Tax=Mycobacterium sp. 1274756.6 TaxID=1834076 RepID=UPI0007FE54F7|nr:hypothetical protein [Mycobacterium sp. 1274756.6]OBJ70204.1 hypothetical protein A5643_01025 [Mycobacterium sp. 1274756.6]